MIDLGEGPYGRVEESIARHPRLARREGGMTSIEQMIQFYELVRQLTPTQKRRLLKIMQSDVEGNGQGEDAVLSAYRSTLDLAGLPDFAAKVKRW